MSKVLYGKRGDTFFYFAKIQVPGVQLSQLKSQVRDTKFNFISDVVITATENPQIFKFTVQDTTRWPITSLVTDIQITNAEGRIISTQTFQIKIEKDVTE